MNKFLSLGMLLASLAVLTAPVHALDRGDIGYICYTARDGFMWKKLNHSCRVRVLENTSGGIRVQAEESCFMSSINSSDQHSRGDTWWARRGVYSNKSICD